MPQKGVKKFCGEAQTEKEFFLKRNCHCQDFEPWRPWPQHLFIKPTIFGY